MRKDDFSLKLEGVDELKKALKTVGPAVEKKAAVSATRRPAILLRKRLRSGVKRMTGQLAAAISYRKIRYRRNSGLVGYKVYNRGMHYQTWVKNKKIARALAAEGRLSTKGIPNAALMRMFEYGSSARSSFPQSPFWNRTVDSSDQQLVGEIIDGLAEGVDKEAGKAFARLKRGRR